MRQRTSAAGRWFFYGGFTAVPRAPCKAMITQEKAGRFAAAARRAWRSHRCRLTLARDAERR
jgi:hypothetical protein